MDVYGIDFTSSPSRKKPLTCAHCQLADGALHLVEEFLWDSYEGFERFLQQEGVWVAALDFPFGQPRQFIEAIGWPETWADYTRHVQQIGKKAFCEEIKRFKAERAGGDKEYFRETDRYAGGVSPMKIDFVPVGRMFAEGAPRLLDSPALIPHLKTGDADRVIVEAYPGVAVKTLVGDKNNYKSDDRRKQSEAQLSKRLAILEAAAKADNPYGFPVNARADVATDPTGDRLDALLCAVQAAWAWLRREEAFGAPKSVDPLEGWIADPTVFRLAKGSCLR